MAENTGRTLGEIVQNKRKADENAKKAKKEAQRQEQLAILAAQRAKAEAEQRKRSEAAHAKEVSRQAGLRALMEADREANEEQEHTEAVRRAQKAAPSVKQKTPPAQPAPSVKQKTQPHVQPSPFGFPPPPSYHPQLAPAPVPAPATKTAVKQPSNDSPKATVAANRGKRCPTTELQRRKEAAYGRYKYCPDDSPQWEYCLPENPVPVVDRGRTRGSKKEPTITYHDPCTLDEGTLFLMNPPYPGPKSLPVRSEKEWV